MRLTPRALCAAGRAAFRESFPLGGRDVARWFPGHMAKGLRKMQSSLKLVDCIIEVHDARIPLSGRNPLFQETLGLKPHLLVLNKMDLADLKEQQKIMQHLEREGLKNVIFTNCVKDENIKQVTELVGSSYRYHRGENLEYCIMVIGVPNVGKSSLINALRRQHLRKGKATKVGGEPGITRAVMSRVQVCERPLMFLLDTPGVLAPRIQNVETGLKLALCGTVLDHLVGEETLADYLLYTLNRHQLLGDRLCRRLACRPAARLKTCVFHLHLWRLPPCVQNSRWTAVLSPAEKSGVSGPVLGTRRFPGRELNPRHSSDAPCLLFVPCVYAPLAALTTCLC
ncbi:mitochondrial ribosome-associated GTPase 1 isoform X2 [Phacochoerus africanus]|uniref:mitochondrial ribosome-associated GTPase 1 isoform X2 n=1 Tax=Phacochoerus africanus TaxID=41426 RepID=UPI001FD9AEB2|nr:mitochondrial ribosome-associated GTPase 1 isoform X2 [Phacochoerus africanus]